MSADPRRSNTALSVAEKLPVPDSLNGEVPILMQAYVIRSLISCVCYVWVVLILWAL